MSLTITANANQKIAKLQPVGRMYYGYGAFTTSGTTVEVAVPFKKIFAFFITYIGTPATTDGEPSVNETEADDVIVNSGTVTVTRAAGTTSGLKFSFLFIGE